jgi:hypothetical protein
MLPYLKYNQTNWIDGMKINKDHFIAIENNLISKYHDSIATGLNSFNYGILPSYNGKPSFDVAINFDKNNLLRVNVHELRAITSAGVRIEISEKNEQYVQQSTFTAEIDMKSLGGKDFYVVLSVNPFGRVPAGEPDAEEVPPRYPYADYDYQVNVVSADELLLPSSGYYHLCIGKMQAVGSRYELMDAYIPPCASVLGSSDLTDFYEQLDKAITKLENDCTTIIQKIFTKQQTNVLTDSVLYLTEAVIQQLSSTITNYRWFIKEQPPIYLFAYFTALARVMRNSIDLKLGDGKEQMLTYFKNWIVEVNQGEFEKILDEMVNVQYNHLEIDKSLDRLQAFCVTIATVFSKLAKLDYIGDKKEKFNMIVKTEQADTGQVKKKRSLFIE